MTTSTIPLEQYTKEVSILENEVKFLREQVEWFKKQLFGQKADKFVDPRKSQQLYFEGFDKLAIASPEEKQKIPEHERKKERRMGKTKLLFLLIFPSNVRF